jgi:hypothetical protein
MANLAAPVPINVPQVPVLPAIQPEALEEVVVAAGKKPPHLKMFIHTRLKPDVKNVNVNKETIFLI